MSQYVQIVTTTETQDDAGRIARTLVEKRLAACVQVLGPMTSTFRWKGAVERCVEWQCVAKSRRDLYERIEEAIREVHPYDEPEILATPVVAGSPSYLAWLDAEVGGE